MKIIENGNINLVIQFLTAVSNQPNNQQSLWAQHSLQGLIHLRSKFQFLPRQSSSPYCWQEQLLKKNIRIQVYMNPGV